MQVQCKFRKMPWSEELVAHVQSKLERLEKLEWKPSHVDVVFTAERHECRVDLNLRGQKLKLRSSARAESFLECIDAAVAKLGRQLSRRKARVQDHLVPENTHLGKMERLALLMEDVRLPRRRRAG